MEYINIDNLNRGDTFYYTGYDWEYYLVLDIVGYKDNSITLKCINTMQNISYLKIERGSLSYARYNSISFKEKVTQHSEFTNTRTLYPYQVELLMESSQLLKAKLLKDMYNEIEVRENFSISKFNIANENKIKDIDDIREYLEYNSDGYLKDIACRFSSDLALSFNFEYDKDDKPLLKNILYKGEKLL